MFQRNIKMNQLHKLLSHVHKYNINSNQTKFRNNHPDQYNLIFQKESNYIIYIKIENNFVDLTLISIDKITVKVRNNENSDFTSHL